MSKSHQKEQLPESNKILMELVQLIPGDSSSTTSVTELVAAFQGIKAEKELNQQKRSLQATERDLRNKVTEEIDKRWKAIECLKSEIITLQTKCNCNEITPQMLSDQTLKESISSKTLVENMRQKRTLLFPLIVAAVLVFYALGIATNFFALPVFSPFFILSYNTAHVAAYDVAVAGVGLIAATLVLNFDAKNRKKVLNESSALTVNQN